MSQSHKKAFLNYPILLCQSLAHLFACFIHKTDQHLQLFMWYEEFLHNFEFIFKWTVLSLKQLEWNSSKIKNNWKGYGIEPSCY